MWVGSSAITQKMSRLHTVCNLGSMNREWEASVADIIRRPQDVIEQQQSEDRTTPVIGRWHRHCPLNTVCQWHFIRMPMAMLVRSKLREIIAFTSVQATYVNQSSFPLFYSIKHEWISVDMLKKSHQNNLIKLMSHIIEQLVSIKQYNFTNIVVLFS